MIVIQSNFYLRCMFSEKTRFYCQLTSSSVVRHAGSVACTHFFMTDSERATMTSWWSSCNVLATMHGFRDNKVVLPTGHDVIVISQPGGALHAIFHEVFWKSDHDFMTVVHSTFYLRWMVYEILRFFPTGYDVIVSLPPGVLYAIFHDRFWKSDQTSW